MTARKKPATTLRVELGVRRDGSVMTVYQEGGREGGQGGQAHAATKIKRKKKNMKGLTVFNPLRDTLHVGVVSARRSVMRSCVWTTVVSKGTAGTAESLH